MQYFAGKSFICNPVKCNLLIPEISRAMTGIFLAPDQTGLE
jgi:hypothetical protein